MCIFDKQRYSFNRIYKYKRPKYYISKKLTKVHAMWNRPHPKYMIYLYKAEVIVHY